MVLTTDSFPFQVVEDPLGQDVPTYSFDHCKGSSVGLWYSYYAETEKILQFRVSRENEDDRGGPPPSAILIGSSCDQSTCLEDFLYKGSRLFATAPNTKYFFFVGREETNYNAQKPLQIDLLVRP